MHWNQDSSNIRHRTLIHAVLPWETTGNSRNFLYVQILPKPLRLAYNRGNYPGCATEAEKRGSIVCCFSTCQVLKDLVVFPSLKNVFKFIAKFYFLVRKGPSKLTNTYRIFLETFWTVWEAYEDFHFEWNHRGVLYDLASLLTNLRLLCPFSGFKNDNLPCNSYLCNF